jgi:hypothetical protein
VVVWHDEFRFFFSHLARSTDFEMAATIQAIEQYYVNAELQRTWELSEQKDNEVSSKGDLADFRMEKSQETDALLDKAAAYTCSEESGSYVAKEQTDSV